MAFLKAKPSRDTAAALKQSQETSSEFEERFSALASSAYTLLGVALGGRLGLFHKMAAMEEPWTPRELAEAGDWKERYVLEWLGAMVCAGIVEVVPSAEGDRYVLPKHRREVMTGPVVAFHEALPINAAVHEDIVACFAKDGPKGVSYSKYPHFHEWRNERMETANNWDFIQRFNSLTPGLTEKLERGGRFLGIGCSTGVVDCIYAAKFPNSTFIGVDISEHAISQAKDKVTKLGLKNLEFCVKDVYEMPTDWADSFDGVIVIDVLHDLPHPQRAAREFRHVLKSGGILAIFDVFGHSRIADNIGYSSASMMYTLSLYHCMSVSLYSGGEGVGNMWGRERVFECLKGAGFDEVLEPEEGTAQYVCFKK